MACVNKHGETETKYAIRLYYALYSVLEVQDQPQGDAYTAFLISTQSWSKNSATA